jgi:vacuolar-type H+-ATPase subunit F/Vma7
MSKQKRDDHAIIILHNLEILDETDNCEQVHAILLMISENYKNENRIIKENYKKVVGIFIV